MSRVVHFEISSDNPEKSAQFYQEVFGWEITKWGGPVEYWLVTTGPKDAPGIDGGIMRRSEPFTDTVNTIGVDDIDAFMEKVKACGGELVGEKQPIPGVGYQIYCRDSEGALFGLHQADPNATM